MRRVFTFIAALLRKLADSTEYVNCPDPACGIRQPVHPELIKTGLLSSGSDQARLLHTRYILCKRCLSIIPLDAPDRSPPYGEDPPM